VTNDKLRILLSELRSFPNETEWLEFKVNNAHEIGEYISALSNAACIHEKEYGYIVFGIDDKTHRIVGTAFTPFQKGKGNEDLIPWITRLLDPRIHFDHFEFEAEEKPIVIIRIRAASNTPVKFSGEPYIRIGSYKKRLAEHPEKERLIWTKEPSSAFEKEIAAYNVTAEEVLKLIDYPSYFDLMKIPLPDNRSLIFEKLVQEKQFE
jgi:ATP-dependent DNA helicase RecG